MLAHHVRHRSVTLDLNNDSYLQHTSFSKTDISEQS
jgi:hypothetical protein